MAIVANEMQIKKALLKKITESGRLWVNKNVVLFCCKKVNNQKVSSICFSFKEAGEFFGLKAETLRTYDVAFKNGTRKRSCMRDKIFFRIDVIEYLKKVSSSLNDLEKLKIG